MNIDCIICYENYNDSNRKPYLLISCGHTICGECSELIDNCPKCRKKIEGKVENWDLIPSERKQSNLISVNSNESKVNLIQECKR